MGCESSTSAGTTTYYWVMPTPYASTSSSYPVFQEAPHHVVSPLSLFRWQVLQATNRYRAKHGAPPMVLDDTVCAFSQNWAQHLARTGQTKHSSDKLYGENWWWLGSGSTETTCSGEAPVKTWYDEIKDYKYDNQKPPGTGHFTQLVWDTSVRLGVGYAEGSAKWAKEFYVVCNYDPKGNYKGQYSQHVHRPL